MDDVEKQIERAMAARWKPPYGSASRCDDQQERQWLRDLLAGKFKEEPLPEIAPPPWPHTKLYASAEPGTDGQECYVYCTDYDWGTIKGPCRRNCREAIEAWNAVFGSKP